MDLDPYDVKRILREELHEPESAAAVARFLADIREAIAEAVDADTFKSMRLDDEFLRFVSTGLACLYSPAARARS